MSYSVDPHDDARMNAPRIIRHLGPWYGFMVWRINRTGVTPDASAAVNETPA